MLSFMVRHPLNLSRLAWLSALLAGHRHRLTLLVGRLSDLGPLATMKPNVLRRFLDTLDQVAAEKDKEMALIGQIETVERQHSYRRKHGQVIKASDTERPVILQPLPTEELCQDKPPERSSSRWLLWLLLFVTTRQNDKEKQQLNVG
jgi:hypothetical protein